MEFDWSVASASVGPLLEGALITVLLTLVVIVASLMLGLPVAFARMSETRIVRVLASAYIDLIRSTPLLLQLVYIYFALPVVGIKLSPYVAGLIGLTLHYTAYIAEVYRAGIEAIPKGQVQAGAALGMSSFQISRKIVLPQAIRIVIPALGNYLVSLFKDTSLVSVLSVQELLFAGQLVAARTYDYFTVYTMVFGFYLAIGLPALWLVRYLERKAASGYGTRRPNRPADVLPESPAKDEVILP
jgi:His/Glu/Gln/Arg/opine family amino acid ABC transporter permease subunit